MPIYGTLDLTRAEPGPFVDTSRRDPLEVKVASILQCTFEARHAGFLGRIPSPFHPTNPPAVTFTVIRCRETELGEFSFAHVGLLCRSGTRMQSFLTRTVVSSESVASELSSRWGYRVEVGEVRLRRYFDQVLGAVTLDGDAVLEVASLDPIPLAAGDARFVDYMNFAETEQGPRLVQVDPSYVVHQAERGAARLTSFAPARWDAEGLECTVPITATYTECEMSLPELRFLCRVDAPATEGTESLVNAAG